MRFRMIKAAFAGLVLTVSGFANAGLILSASDVTTNMGNRFSGDISNTIDQSGLNTTFISGVTDFDTYNPALQTIGNFSSAQWWGAANVLGVTDFDLGAIYNLSRLVLWNANTIFGVKDFSVLIDDNAAFSSAINMGTFSANFAQSTGQVFNLSTSTGRYVRIVHQTTHNTSSNINEIAFDVTPVPEPSALAILALGLIGLGARRFKK